jgi:hypothetical protein
MLLSITSSLGRENKQTKAIGEVKFENLRPLHCLARNESKYRGNSSLNGCSGAFPEPISREAHDKTSLTRLFTLSGALPVRERNIFIVINSV